MKDVLSLMRNLCRRRFSAVQQRRLLKKVEGVLSSQSQCNTEKPELDFDKLQRTRKPPAEYGYSPIDAWRRGVQRALEIADLPEFNGRVRNALEVGCGDGMVGKILSTYGCRVTLMDCEDWRDIRAKELPFICNDISISNDSLNKHQLKFDLLFSYNAFEHFRDPVTALENLKSLCSNDGFIYLQFDPLYSAPWGLHAHGTLNMPYPQFLFSKAFLNTKLNEIGIWYYGKKQSNLLPVNCWKLQEYRRLWAKSGLTVCWENYIRDTSHLDIALQYPAAFSGRGLNFDDLTITGVQILFRKVS